jgi:hypothetical protein
MLEQAAQAGRQGVFDYIDLHDSSLYKKTVIHAFLCDECGETWVMKATQ